MTSFSLRSVIGGTLTHCGVERRRGLHARGGAASHCKHSSLTNKVLLLIINGNEGGSERSVVVVRCVVWVGVVNVCVCVFAPYRR